MKPDQKTYCRGHRKKWRLLLTTLIVAASVAGCRIVDRVAIAPTDRPPNIVIIFTDDQGYQDAGCFGSPNIKTPNLDRMAAEGMRFTSFYVGQAVCSASRATLMTGCYPIRVSIQGALGPGANYGLSSKELTIARMLKDKGYATGMF